MNPHRIRTNKQLGPFMFFVIGLFMLQIAFAFTIHGDIGPQTNILPCIEKPASPILVGKIDSLVNSAKRAVITKVSPEGAFAPASKKILEARVTDAKIDTRELSSNMRNAVSTNIGSRFYEYRIQLGDTIEQISRSLYGNSEMVQSLIRLNRIVDDKSLQLGATIMVPKTGLLSTIKIN